MFMLDYKNDTLFVERDVQGVGLALINNAQTIPTRHGVVVTGVPLGFMHSITAAFHSIGSSSPRHNAYLIRPDGCYRTSIAGTLEGNPVLTEGFRKTDASQTLQVFMNDSPYFTLNKLIACNEFPLDKDGDFTFYHLYRKERVKLTIPNMLNYISYFSATPTPDSPDNYYKLSELFKECEALGGLSTEEELYDHFAQTNLDLIKKTEKFKEDNKEQ